MKSKIFISSVMVLVAGIQFVNAQITTSKPIVVQKVDRVRAIFTNLDTIIAAIDTNYYNLVNTDKSRIKLAILAKKNVTGINNLIIEMDANLADAKSNDLYAGKMMKGITKETSSNASTLTVVEASIAQAKLDLSIVKKDLPLVDAKLKSLGF